MAIVWKQKKSGVVYEVRSAGKSLRLYTDGVFHSQYNPDKPVTGQVWDLLMLPAFFYPEGSIKRILVMGVGGGTVIQMLNTFIEPESIVGVELNKTHLSIARLFFGLKRKNITLVQADAVNWLKSYNEMPFDMIIDDMFTEQNGEPALVASANASWFNLMLKHLSRDGVIVKNFVDRASVLKSAPVKQTTMASRFKSVFQFSTPYNENRVAAYLKIKADSQILRQRLLETPGLNPRLKTSRLRYTIKNISA